MIDRGDALVPARPGERWVIRRRLPDGSAADVLGWVDALTATSVRVTTAEGHTYEVDRAEVVAARRVPAAAGGPDPRRVSAEALEQITLTGWLALSEPLGDWTLRAGGGFTGRANSCLAVGDPALPMEEAAQRIVGHAAQHQIPPMAQVVLGSTAEAGLRAEGWVDSYVTTEVLVTPLGSFLDLRPPDPRVSVTETLTDSWRTAYDQSRPNTADPEMLRMILDGHPPRAFASVVDGVVVEGGAVFAIARGSLSGDWLGLASIWTRQDRRRRGWATMMMTALGHWAARRGVRYVYLQVAVANQAAITAYERLGFRRHHRYGYLAPPGIRQE
jgi:ribosomal protein S18 acetylase RimI-like enzyme